MEKASPGKYHFILDRDAAATGRLEVEISKKGSDKRVLVHSKANGQGWASSNWDAFDQRVNDALKQISA